MDIPLWMGQNSKRKKEGRLQTEMAVNINAGQRSEEQKVTLTPTKITLDYSEIQKIKLMASLYVKGKEDIPEGIEFMNMYNLTKEH